MKKVKSLEDIPSIINYIEKHNLTLTIYFDYIRGGAYNDFSKVIYIENRVWNYYYNKKGIRVTPIYKITRDDLIWLIYQNLKQINDRYFDRKYYIFPRHYFKD